MGNFAYTPTTLCPLKKQRLLQNIAIIDIETTRWIDDTHGMSQKQLGEWHNKPIEPFLLGLLKDNEVTFYEGKNCIEDFLKDWLVYQNRNYITFAHNGGKFDFIPLYEATKRDPLLSKRFFSRPFMAHSRMLALTIKDHHKHAWKFRDSYALLSAGLSNLCRDWKPEHKKLELPEDIPYEGNETLWKTYLTNDLWSLYEILKMFNEVIADVGGSVSYTIAGTAMATFRKKFLKQEIPTYFIWNDFIREGYSGGRVEIFNMYAMDVNSPYYYYDCNSEFPSVMLKDKFAVSKPKRVHYKDADECKGKCGMMECDVITPPDLDIPILPYRADEKKLLFPLGNWTATYEFCLIEKALEYGYDIRPRRVIEFEGENIFHDYVSTFYDLKSHSEGAVKQTMKLLLNSLYGKFGEKPDKEELITDPSEDITGTFPMNDDFGYSIRKFRKHNAHHLPEISARVTALAQLRLYSFIEDVQRRGGTVYYCDTDSVITDCRMPTSKLLGEFKLEHEFYEGVFLAPKTYCLHTYDKDEELIQTLKGFSKYKKRHLDFEDYVNALPPKNDYTAFHENLISPASFKTIMRRHLDGFVTEVTQKSIKSSYNKREILENLTTRPLQVIDGLVQWKRPPSSRVRRTSTLPRKSPTGLHRRKPTNFMAATTRSLATMT